MDFPGYTFCNWFGSAHIRCEKFGDRRIAVFINRICRLIAGSPGVEKLHVIYKSPFYSCKMYGERNFQLTCVCLYMMWEIWRSEWKMKVLSARADVVHTTAQQIISRRGWDENNCEMHKSEIFAKRVKLLLFIDKDKVICDLLVPVVVVAA